MTNRTLQNLHRDTIVEAITNDVIDAAKNGEKKHNAYINRKVLMSHTEADLRYIMDRVHQNFPESPVSLKVTTRGQHRDITLSDLSLVLVTCTLNDEARIAICVDWSSI